MREERRAYVYILASGRNGTLYIGMTAQLAKRVYEHKHKMVEGFTQKYGVDKLVYYEVYDDMLSAIEREKKLKKYKREYKINLIVEQNPDWNDLYETF